ncbi:UNKNOWN [Stylonychia lemnae]|uniref:Uncharacterized protein n=1 Tax=Stylonychia lemnae TaxID=5949 RepID=A0A078AMT1_STYLE|nr:UNKNOWN [Stylonychia lemnae]|eukprot:CDW82183.1 UNKNOWN [Stylonychia lemnae]
MDDIYIAKVALTSDLNHKMQQHQPYQSTKITQKMDSQKQLQGVNSQNLNQSTCNYTYHFQYYIIAYNAQTRLLDTQGNELSYSLGYSESDLNTTLGGIVNQTRLLKQDSSSSQNQAVVVTRPRNLSFGNNGAKNSRRSQYLMKRGTNENSVEHDDTSEPETNHYWSRSRHQQQQHQLGTQQIKYPQQYKRPEKVTPDDDRMGSENISSDEGDEVNPVVATSSSSKNLHQQQQELKQKRDQYRSNEPHTNSNKSFLLKSQNPIDTFMNEETVPNTITQRYEKQAAIDHSNSAKNILNQAQHQKRLQNENEQSTQYQAETNVKQIHQQYNDDYDEEEIQRFNRSILQNFKAYEEPPSQRLMKTDYSNHSLKRFQEGQLGQSQNLNVNIINKNAVKNLDNQSSSLASSQSQHSLMIEREVSNSSKQNLNSNLENIYNNLQQRIIQKVLDTDIKSSGNAHSITRKNNNDHTLDYTHDQLNMSYYGQNVLKNFQRENKQTGQVNKSYLDKKFENLYNENAIKQQKLKRIQELKEMQKIFQEQQECTFSPKICRNELISPRGGVDSSEKANQHGQLKKMRSPQKFYDDMLTFKQQRDLKVSTLRQLEEFTIKSEASIKRGNLMNQKSRAEMFDRLHQEELKKLKLNNLSPQSQVKQENSSSRTREEIVNHLYTDYFIRDTKLKSLQNQVFTQEHNQHQEAINLGRSNQVLANKIQSQVKQAYTEMELEQQDELSFFNLLELMTKCGYIDQFDEELRNQLNSMWMNLIKDQSLNTEATITQRNLLIFLMAVDNIFLDSMKLQPYGPQEKRQFGYFLNEYYYVQNEQEVKKMHMHYQRLYLNRQRRLEELKRQSSNQQLISSPSQKECVFTPNINPKSKQIADESIIKLEQAIRQGTGDNQVKIKVEDLLLSKGQVIQEKLRQQRQIHQQQQEDQYTFSPQLLTSKANQSYLRLQSNSNSVRRKNSSGNPTQGAKSRNVFDKLYAKALTQQKQKVQEKTRFEVVEEQEYEQCTFKPNLNRTQKINQQVTSIIKKSSQFSQQKHKLQNYRNNMNRLTTQRSQPKFANQYKYNNTYEGQENISNLCITSNQNQGSSFVQYLQNDITPQSMKNNLLDEIAEVTAHNRNSFVQPFNEHNLNYDSRQNSEIKNQHQTPKNAKVNRVQFSLNSTYNTGIFETANKIQTLHTIDENANQTQENLRYNLSNKNLANHLEGSRSKKNSQYLIHSNNNNNLNDTLNSSNYNGKQQSNSKSDLTTKQVKQYLKTVIQSSL